MNAFDGFARVRSLLADKPCRPTFAFVSASGTCSVAYAHGADVVSTKDNAPGERRRESRSRWQHVADDVLALWQAPPPLASGRVPSDDESVPSYWSAASSGATSFSEMVAVNEPSMVQALEAALELTFKRSSDGTAHSTRDRQGGKPRRFRLAQAYRVEDSHLWKAYARHRASLGSCEPISACVGPGGPPKTAAVPGLPELSPDVNETYLFHGTSPEAAQSIIHSGFRIDLAGTSAGCAFGKGAYLAEACTKSDEYAKHGEGLFSQMYAMLLCRTSLGRVVRVEDFYHSSSTVRSLVDDEIISQNVYQCLLGDREAAVGTYREFIVFQREQIYPEFVLLYHRDT